MRNKACLLILSALIVAAFGFVSSPPIARAQTTPTIIYQTDFEDEPPLPDSTTYGRQGDQEWNATCGVDSSGCTYRTTTSNNGNPVDTEYYRAFDYFEETPDNDIGTTWEECAVNYVEFDLYYVAPAQTSYTDTSRFVIALSTDNDAAIGSGIESPHYDYLLEVDFLDLPGNEQGEWFHVAVPLENTTPMNSYNIRWISSQTKHINNGIEPNQSLFELRIDNLTVWCDYIPDDLIRPLSLEDEHPQWEMFDESYAEGLDPLNTRYPTGISQGVHAFSEGVGALVHSAAPGTVIEMRPLEPLSDCPNLLDLIQFVSNLYLGPQQYQCYVFIPEEVTDEGNPLLPSDGNNTYRLNLTDTWIVTLDIGGTYISYMLANADHYLEIGQEIGGGCIIGETIQLLRMTEAELEEVSAEIGGGTTGIDISGGVGFGINSVITNNGYVELLRHNNGSPLVTTPLLGSLTRYSLSDDPCGDDPRFANCLGSDPTLRSPDADGRTTQGSVSFDNPGYSLLSTNSLIREVMSLDDSTEYGLSVDIEVIDPTPRLELKLGETEEIHTVSEAVGEIVTLSIEADLHPADLTDYWTVEVRNLSTAAFKVLSICVSEGDVAGQPTACYFANPSFDSGYANWDISENVGQRDGSITVPTGETFGQEATLPADEEDTTFQVYLDVYIWTEPGVVIERDDFTSTVEIEYQFPDEMADWEPLITPNSTDSITFSEFALAAERQGVTIGTLSFQAFITIDEDTTGTVTFRPTITTEVVGVLGVGIDRACLRGDFGVDQIEDIYGPQCQEVTRPQDENLSSWTVWLWRQFDRFFQCDLMIVLRQIRNTTTEIYRLTGWSIRYWKAYAIYQGQWLGTQVFPWLNGHFRNIAIGNVAVIASGSTCGSDAISAIVNFFTGACGTGLFDVLSSLVNGILNTINLLIGAVATLLGLIITALFTLVYLFFTRIFNLIGQLLGLIGALVTAWQTATPTAIPGFPTCETDPTTNILCIPLYILENTIFESGTPGELILILIVGWGSVELILWVIASIRDGIAEAANSG